MNKPYRYTCNACGHVWEIEDHVLDMPVAGFCDECGEDENAPSLSMRDVALLLFWTYCLARGLVFVFAATAITTNEAWEAVRVVIG